MTLTPEIYWIDTPEALNDACAEVAGADVIALDTEFFREKTFYPVPALVQFCAGDVAYLVDPTVVACTEAFRCLLSEGPLKLLHSLGEDLEVFTQWAGVSIAPLVDTQIAQALLGEVPSMGYQKLVEFWVGETLPKDETRSNWLKRPLSDTQKTYAALDVTFLLSVWRAQRESLERHGRMAWLEEECASLVDQATRDEQSDGQWYLRQRQLWRLTPCQIEAYRRLTIWREGEVRHRDLPRGWLVSDKLLYAIAERMPENRYELADIEGIKPPLVKREGDNLLALVREARHVADEQLPTPPWSPMDAAFKKRITALKKVIGREAEGLGIAPEFILSRRHLEALVGASLRGEALPLPEGWRGERLAGALKDTLQDKAQQDNTSRAGALHERSETS